jgi:hypothetical protein
VHGYPEVIDNADRRGEFLSRKPAGQQAFLPENPRDLDPCEIHRLDGRRAVNQLLLKLAGMLKPVLVDEPAQNTPVSTT